MTITLPVLVFLNHLKMAKAFLHPRHLSCDFCGYFHHKSINIIERNIMKNNDNMRNMNKKAWLRVGPMILRYVINFHSLSHLILIISLISFTPPLLLLTSNPQDYHLFHFKEEGTFSSSDKVR